MAFALSAEHVVAVFDRRSQPEPHSPVELRQNRCNEWEAHRAAREVFCKSLSWPLDRSDFTRDAEATSV